MSSTHSFCVNPCFSRLSQVNAVLTAKIKTRYQSSCTTNLTIKTVISGTARYATPRSVYSVEPRTCVVLNRGQTYDLDILATANTETLAFFFEPKFVQQALSTLATSELKLLDDPEHTNAVSRPFVEAMQPMNGSLGETIAGIAHRLRRDTSGELWLEDAFYELASLLPALNRHAMAEWTRLPAKRNTTRKELYRRLAYARDYAYACYDEELSVQKLASIATLSPFHFHRMFRHMFGVTSSHFVRERRLIVARMLLESTSHPVTQICFDVGFNSPSSFSTLFRQRFGLSPVQLRQQQND